MWSLRVFFWWAVMRGLQGLQRVMVWVMYLPMTALEATCHGFDAAEIEWLLACSERRLARRRRVNLDQLAKVTLEDLERLAAQGGGHGQRG